MPPAPNKFARIATVCLRGLFACGAFLCMSFTAPALLAVFAALLKHIVVRASAEPRLPKPAAFVAKTLDGFVHQLLVVRAIEVHSLALDLLRHSRRGRLVDHGQCVARRLRRLLPAPARSAPAPAFLRRPRFAFTFTKFIMDSCAVGGAFLITFSTPNLQCPPQLQLVLLLGWGSTVYIYQPAVCWLLSPAGS